MKFVLREGLPKESGKFDGWGARLNNRKLRTGSGSTPPARLPSTAKGQGIAQRRHQTSETQHTHAGQRDRDRQGSGELQRRRREKILLGHFPKNKCRLKILFSLGNPLYYFFKSLTCSRDPHSMPGLTLCLDAITAETADCSGLDTVVMAKSEVTPARMLPLGKGSFHGS